MKNIFISLLLLNILIINTFSQINAENVINGVNYINNNVNGKKIIHKGVNNNPRMHRIREGDVHRLKILQQQQNIREPDNPTFNLKEEEVTIEYRNYTNKRPNIIVILADDLGYGDTSVKPFVGMGIYTPNLERMAARGTIMTNFHTAAATCTPTRASILTGLYPWRIGIKAVFEYGLKGKSNRDDYLPQLPTVATVFRDDNYFTGHSGKWHIGGMRNDDLEMRLLPANIEGQNGGKRCPHPGPNQQGFEEYVSVLDGPGSKRQNELQVSNRLHSHGCSILLRDDIDISKDKNSKNHETLSDCETRHAIRMMTKSVDENKPFYIHLWFHAPHGPWEKMSGYDNIYPLDPNANNIEKLPHCQQNKTTRFCYNYKPNQGNSIDQARQKKIMDRGASMSDKYKTMVTSMDKSIGTLMNAIRRLNILQNTLIVFISDNGPEDLAGTTAGLKGNKRFLYEGGIRVPSIWQWVGTIPAGKKIDTLGVTTDLFPTFLDVADIKKPKTVSLDGMSLLSALKGEGDNELLTNRVILWHGDYEGPRATAALLYEYKVLFNNTDYPRELYDLKLDKYERNNLLLPFENDTLSEILDFKRNIQEFNKNNFVNNDFNRSDSNIHQFIVSHTYKTMKDFAEFGDEAYQIYLSNNQHRNYTHTPLSDNRRIRANPYKYHTAAQADVMRKNLFSSNCSLPCTCEIPKSNILSLSFNNIQESRKYLNPNGFLDGRIILDLK
jgi:arylsulfatase A-like enzyme